MSNEPATSEPIPPTTSERRRFLLRPIRTTVYGGHRWGGVTMGAHLVDFHPRTGGRPTYDGYDSNYDPDTND